MLSRGAALAVGKRVVADVTRKNVTFMAAGIAYNALVSLAPLLVLLLLAVSLVGGGLEARLVDVAGESLPGPIADVVGRIFAGEAAASGASVVGLVVLVWGTLKIFRGLDTAFSEIYETERGNSLVDQFVDGVVVLVGLVVAVVATVAVSGVFAAVADDLPAAGLLTPVVLLAGLVVAFLPMYYRFPDTDLGWREVLPGAVVAAVGWAALQAVFQVYLLFRGGGAESILGGVLVVVTWLYFSGLVLLLGAVLNAVIAGRSTGTPGGVGRTTVGDAGRIRTRTALAGDDLAAYLRVLRERLTGRYEGLAPTADPIRRDRRPADGDGEGDGDAGRDPDDTRRRGGALPAPDGDVEVLERASTDGREWTVTLRWRTAADESDT